MGSGFYHAHSQGISYDTIARITLPEELMSEKKRLVVADNVVVTMDLVLKVDNQVVEDTAESDAIQFLQGVGQVLPALEGQLYGMAVGDRKEIVLSATEGYGEIDD